MGAVWRGGIAVRAALALASVLGPTWAQAQMLASIPVEVVPQRDVLAAAASPAHPRVRVHAADAPGLARFLGLPGSQAGSAGYVELSLAPGAHPDVAASGDALAASFLVDFNEPAVVRLYQQLLDERGGAPIGGEQVVAFVAKTVQSDYAVNADLASQVARVLRGDCTEHSLLTAALARSARIPARIVHGAALIHADGRWQAYGHAWVQTYEGGRWIVRDSALAGVGQPVHYVPSNVLDNEGPGHKIGLFQGIGRMPSRVEILDAGAAPPAGR